MAGKKEGESAFASVERIYMQVASAIPIPQPRAWVYTFFHPLEGYSQNKKEASAVPIAIHLVLAGLLSFLASFLMGLFGLNPLAFGIRLLGIALVPLFYLVGGFIASAIHWILAKILGGKGSFMEQTLALSLILGGYALVAFPFTVLSGIPCIGILFWLVIVLISLYSIYCFYLLIKEVHGISDIKALVVVLLPLVVAILALIAMAFALALFGRAMLGSMGSGYFF
ncbi:MAG: YIP1 family protein [Candidatus Micrarchaeota archaeon]|nr:YIP1 family protein [Candidatus Micrarchaeota archaeon]